MQFDTGISISRYFPAIGTAGLLRDWVSGNSRVPRPPPRINEMTRGMTLLLNIKRMSESPTPDHVRFDHLARAIQVASRRLHVQPHGVQLVTLCLRQAVAGDRA